MEDDPAKTKAPVKEPEKESPKELPNDVKKTAEEDADDPQLASALHLLKSWNVFSQVFKSPAP
jgi:uncharacterized Zn finger protein (UPF0148 family)